MRQRLYNLLAIGILIGVTNLGFSTGPLRLSSATAGSHRLVSLYADGQKRVLSTDASTVGEVISQAGIKFADGDLAEPTVSTQMPAAGPYNVNVYRARPVQVVDGLKTYRIRSAYQSPRLLAQAAGLTVYPEDRYDMSMITDIVDAGTVGEQVTIHRATPLSVIVDGKARVIRTQAATTGSALAAAGIALGLKDTTSAPLDAAVIPGQTVIVTRVSEVVATLTQDLPRPTKTVADPTILKGVTNVRDAGADGQKTVTYRIHYQDGAEIKREVLQVVSETPAKPKVMVVGTKVMFAGSVEYWRPMVEAAAAEYQLDPNMMMRIMSCESGGNATTVSHFIVNGEHPAGLFQYLPSTWRSAGGSDDNIFDGALQIKLTAKKMAAQGTSAWQCR